MICPLLFRGACKANDFFDYLLDKLPYACVKGADELHFYAMLFALQMNVWLYLDKLNSLRNIRLRIEDPVRVDDLTQMFF